MTPRVVTVHSNGLGCRSAQPRLIAPVSARLAIDRGCAQHLNAGVDQPAGEDERRGQCGQADGGKKRCQQQRQYDAEQWQPRVLTLRTEGEGSEYGVVTAKAEQRGARVVMKQA
ncbi:hypothetical protein D3C81_1943670 [compost metagenome]